MSKGASYYGPGGGYAFFSGKDGSRAFVSGQFDAEGLVEDVSGLASADYLGLQVSCCPDLSDLPLPDRCIELSGSRILLHTLAKIPNISYKLNEGRKKYFRPSRIYLVVLQTYLQYLVSTVVKVPVGCYLFTRSFFRKDSMLHIDFQLESGFNTYVDVSLNTSTSIIEYL